MDRDSESQSGQGLQALEPRLHACSVELTALFSQSVPAGLSLEGWALRVTWRGHEG